MILIALVLICVVVAVTIVSKKRGSGGPPSAPAISVPGTPNLVPAYVEALLDRWTASGVMSATQAESIRTFERNAVESTRTPTRGRSNVRSVAEALGYLGGILGIVGIVVLIAGFWDELSDSVRLGVPLAASAAFLIAGSFVPERQSPAMTRLHTFLWFLATGACGVSAWVFTEVVVDIEDLRRQWMAVGITCAVVSAVLWAGRDRPVQQVTALAGAAIGLGTVIGEFASVGLCGIGIWIMGGVVLGVSRWRTGTRAAVDVACGSILLVVGGYLTVADWRGPGLLFTVATGLVLLAPSSVRRIDVPAPTPMITGIIGLLGLVQALPMGIGHFASEAGLLTGLIVWGSGVAVVVATMKDELRMRVVFQCVSGVMFVGGAAVTGAQSVGFATVFGLVTSLGLIGLGTRPGRAVMSIFGLLGTVVFIPWMISHFFPGEGRAPLLIIVSGLLLVGISAVLLRLSGRIRSEIRAPR